MLTCSLMDASWTASSSSPKNPPLPAAHPNPEDFLRSRLERDPESCSLHCRASQAMNSSKVVNWGQSALASGFVSAEAASLSASFSPLPFGLLRLGLPSFSSLRASFETCKMYLEGLSLSLATLNASVIHGESSRDVR